MAPERNENKVIEICEKYYQFCSRIPVVSKGIFYNQSGLVMIYFNFSKEVYKFHETAVELFNPFREGLIREKYKDPIILSKLDSKIKKYGSQYVFEYYESHVTIARVKNKEDLSEIVRTYNSLFEKYESHLDKPQVLKAVYSENKEEDWAMLIYNKEINW